MQHRIPLVGRLSTGGLSAGGLCASCLLTVLLGAAAPLQAKTLEELYQTALMAEKGRGDLREAIRLYQEVVSQQKEEGIEKGLAARAQLRVGICQEKLGLVAARASYQQVTQEFPGQPQVVVAAARRIQLTHQREVELETAATATEAPLVVSAAAGTERTAPNTPTLGMLAEMQGTLVQMTSGVPSPRDSSGDGAPWTWPIPPGGDRFRRRYAAWAGTKPGLSYPHHCVAQVPRQWRFLLDPGPIDPEKGKTYSRREFDDDHWARIAIAQAWEDQGYDGYDGGAWYRVELDIHAEDADRPVYLACGGIDLHAYVYLNGKFAGEHHAWAEPFILDISDLVERQGTNALAIYVYDGMGMGGIYGTVDIHQPEGNANAGDLVTPRQAGGPVLITTSIQERRMGPALPHARRSSAKRYARYAYSQPIIPYAHRSVAVVPAKWQFALDYPPRGPNVSPESLDEYSWAPIVIGEAWEDQGYGNYDGGAWYRTRIRIDAEYDERPILMAFGGIAARDVFVYVNGKLCGRRSGSWREPFLFDISEQAEYHGDNDIAIFVYDDFGMGGLYGLVDIHQPDVRPDGEGSVNRFVANRGGSLDGYRVRNTTVFHTSRRALYARYAHKQPLIPYAHKSIAQVPLEWSFMLDNRSGTGAQGTEYSRRSFDAGDWSRIEVGRAWEVQGHEYYDGAAWYRTEIALDIQDPDRPILLAFGGVDEDGYVYVNGTYVGEHHVWDLPFILDITYAAGGQDTITVAIYVRDSAGMGGIYGMVDVHQPTTETDVSAFVANQGGTLKNRDRPARTWRSLFGLWGRRASRDAHSFRPPRIDYPYRSVAQVPAEWRFTLDHGKPTSEQYMTYPAVDFDDSDWSRIAIGRPWEEQGHRNYDDGAWYRAAIDIEALNDDQPILMAFGGIDQDAWVYVNGELVGEHHLAEPFTLDISAAAEYHGRNVIAIRVYDGGGMGGIYGTIDIHQALAAR